MPESNNGEIDSPSQLAVAAPAQNVAPNECAPMSGGPAVQTTAQLTGATEDEAEKQPAPPDRSVIHVDDCAPATLRYSETLVIYPTLREARDVWLALPPEIKKEALMTIQGNGARYHGWEIYRLWGC